MESVNLIESFSLFKEDKNIDRATLMSIIEDVFRAMLIKKYGTDKNFDIVFLDPYYEDRHHKFLLQLISDTLNPGGIVVFFHGTTNFQNKTGMSNMLRWTWP